jgi:DNA repair exonuclease SbcCD ATPase subunit
MSFQLFKIVLFFYPMLFKHIQPWSNNGHRNSPSNSLDGRVPGPMPLLPSQEELAVGCEEIRRIAADNTLVLEDILGLRQELAVIEDEIHILAKQTIPRLRVDNEMEYRDIIQGGMKLEEQMHALKLIKEEVLVLSSEKMELEALCKELSVKVQSLYRELEQIQSENKQIPAIREGLDDIQEEISRARFVFCDLMHGALMWKMPP